VEFLRKSEEFGPVLEQADRASAFHWRTKEPPHPLHPTQSDHFPARYDNFLIYSVHFVIYLYVSFVLNADEFGKLNNLNKLLMNDNKLEYLPRTLLPIANK
jgi:hypothetical protein